MPCSPKNKCTREITSFDRQFPSHEELNRPEGYTFFWRENCKIPYRGMTRKKK